MDFKSRYKYNTKEDLLGKGGFSRVFKATDVLLERDVALKVFNSEQSARYDLITEIKKVIKFQHDNLCRYYDVAILQTVTAFGEEEQVQVGVMELLNGGELKRYLSKNPQYLNKLLEDVLQGLSYLHKRNIIHRDLKPQNILIKLEEDGPVAKITDFGISKAIDEQGDNSSALLGTVEYMAPEQFNPQKYGIDGQISTHIDLWSFGIMVYELLMGKSLFGSRSHGTSAELVMRNILGEEYLEKLKVLPAPYNEIASLCLVKEASKRVKSADVLLEILRKSYNGNNSFTGTLNNQAALQQDDETLVLNLNGNNDFAEDDAETKLLLIQKPDPEKPGNKPVTINKPATPEKPAAVKEPAPQPKPAPVAPAPKIEEPKPQPVAKKEPEIAPKPAFTPPVPEAPKAVTPPAAPEKPAEVKQEEKPKPIFVAPPKPVEPVAPPKPAPAPVAKQEPEIKAEVKPEAKPEEVKKETVLPEAPKVGAAPTPVKETTRPVTPQAEAKKAPEPKAVAPASKPLSQPETKPAPAAGVPKKKNNNLVILGGAAGLVALLALAYIFFLKGGKTETASANETPAAALAPAVTTEASSEPTTPEVSEIKETANAKTVANSAGKSGYVTGEKMKAGTANAFEYTGNLKNGQPNGKGEQKFKNGSVYNGTFANGNYHNNGTLTLADGSKYELQWKNGKPVSATFNFSNGNVYKGGFINTNGTFSENGKGSMTWADGDKYVGTWNKGKLETGTFYYKDGTLYKGGFVNNKKEGKGKFLYADGGRYEGEFKNDNFHGAGKKFNADNVLTESGTYKNGELVSAAN